MTDWIVDLFYKRDVTMIKRYDATHRLQIQREEGKDKVATPVRKQYSKDSSVNGVSETA